METKHVKFQVREIDDQGRVIGLSAVYNNPDYGRDVVLPGAFAKSLSELGKKYPLFYGHKINVGVSIVEDTREGLATEGFLNLDKQAARDVHSDMKFYKANGLDFGMSIGFLPVDGKVEKKNGLRYLKELMLFENTLTELPMNPKARVTEVKDISEVLDLLAEVKSGRRFSAASKAEITSAIEKLQALIADHEPDAGSEPDEGAATKSAEPGPHHSPLTPVVERLRALVPR